jgi:hypothetical protein
MQSPTRLAISMFALLFLAGCSSTKVIGRQSEMGDEKIARPDRILVYDFGSTPDDVPDDSFIADQISEPSMPPTEEQLEAGRKLGAEVAKNLAAEISAMGLPGLRASDQPSPRPGDLVIRGYFLSVDEGSTAERMLVGFGSGAADLKTFVEGYLMTDRGLRRLGSGEIDSGAKGGTPGLLVPLAVTIATANPIGLAVGGAVKVAGEATGSDTIKGSGKRTAELIAQELRPKFEQQGWIAPD